MSQLQVECGHKITPRLSRYRVGSNRSIFTLLICWNLPFSVTLLRLTIVIYTDLITTLFVSGRLECNITTLKYDTFRIILHLPTIATGWDEPSVGFTLLHVDPFPLTLMTTSLLERTHFLHFKMRAGLFTVVAGIKTFIYIDLFSVVLFGKVNGTCHIKVAFILKIVDVFAYS